MATTSQISAKIGKEGIPFTVEYDLGKDESLDALVDRFSEKIIAAHARSSIVVAAQGVMRGFKAKEKEGGGYPTDAELQAHMTSWLPTLKAPAKSPVEKAKSQLDDLTAEDKANLLKELAAELKAAK